MRACSKLVENRAVPRDRYADVASAVCGRLKDKTAQVRKNALDSVCALLAHNPFAPGLGPGAPRAAEPTLSKRRPSRTTLPRCCGTEEGPRPC